jgi:glutamine amidotransferase
LGAFGHVAGEKLLLIGDLLMRVAVIDYNAGNLKSVANALTYIGAKFYISNEPDKLMKSDKLIFPGVGNAKSAVETVKSMGLDDMIKQYFRTGKDIMGICLGSQIILDYSEEGDTQCLSLIEGSCRRFPKSNLKVPQIGWNIVKPIVKHWLFKNIPNNQAFYFVHSYYTVPNRSENRLCVTEYGTEYASGVIKDNLVAVQFHPERSGEWGLKLLSNFVGQ